MECNVDENCENNAEFRYTWAWGEEGAACADHRALLESKAAQLNRSITFAPVDDTTRRDYKAPSIKLSPEVGKLRMQNAELVEELKASTQRVGELELRVFELEAKLDDLRTMTPDEAPPLSIVEGGHTTVTIPPVERAPIAPPNKRR